MSLNVGDILPHDTPLFRYSSLLIGLPSLMLSFNLPQFIILLKNLPMHPLRFRHFLQHLSHLIILWLNSLAHIIQIPLMWILLIFQFILPSFKLIPKGEFIFLQLMHFHFLFPTHFDFIFNYKSLLDYYSLFVVIVMAFHFLDRVLIDFPCLISFVIFKIRLQIFISVQ